MNHASKDQNRMSEDELNLLFELAEKMFLEMEYDRILIDCGMGSKLTSVFCHGYKSEQYILYVKGNDEIKRLKKLLKEKK